MVFNLKMRMLITMPHVFAPKQGSLYSSENEAKREIKKAALFKATVENITRHANKHWIHASLGKNKPVITREQTTENGIDLEIQLYTPKNKSLAESLPKNHNLSVIDPELSDLTSIPGYASRKGLEQAMNYDYIGYMEDDIMIEDQSFFQKIIYLNEITDGSYAFMPHRCEMMAGLGDVILSGDPDGGRPDLFWDTGETIEVAWPLGNKRFYRATNPHSGCYFLSRRQALVVLQYWQERKWKTDFQLSGPLEQAGSGILLHILKIMKPIPTHYRFLMVRHQDELWRRHKFE